MTISYYEKIGDNEMCIRDSSCAVAGMMVRFALRQKKKKDLHISCGRTAKSAAQQFLCREVLSNLGYVSPVSYTHLISTKTVYNWRRAARLDKGEVCGVKPGETPGQAVERLMRENKELHEANYILRKALGFMAGR